MIKELMAGHLNPYLSSDNTLTAGTLVKLDTANAGKILAANAGDVVVGIVAQDVIAAGVNNFKLDSVTHQARVGDKVGVFYDGGLFITDQFSGNITIGTALYAGATGKFSATVSGSILAYAETAGNSATGDKIRLKVIGF